MSLGTKELDELLSFIVSIGMAVNEAQKDGWDLMDATKFVGPLSKVVPAFSGVSQIDDEIADMTQEEYDASIEKLKSQFDLSDDQLEAVIEKGVDKAGEFILFLYQTFVAKEEESE